MILKNENVKIIDDTPAFSAKFPNNVKQSQFPGPDFHTNRHPVKDLALLKIKGKYLYLYLYSFIKSNFSHGFSKSLALFSILVGRPKSLTPFSPHRSHRSDHGLGFITTWKQMHSQLKKSWTLSAKKLGV